MMDAASALAEEFGFKLIAHTEGFEACGVPLGSATYVAKALENKIDRNNRMFDHLNKMDPQCAQLLLRNCAQPRMGFLLRCVPSAEFAPFAKDFDHCVRGTFARIAGFDSRQKPVTEDWYQDLLCAPFRDGGLGLRSAHSISPAANISSLLMCWPVLLKYFPKLQDLVDDFEHEGPEEEAEAWMFKAGEAKHFIIAWVLDAWMELNSVGCCTKSIPSHPMEFFSGFYEKLAAQANRRKPIRIQRLISQEIASHVGVSLREKLESGVHSDQALVARNLSNQHSGSTAWLRAIPVSRSLRMTRLEFRQALHFFFGLGPSGLPASARCKCGHSATIPDPQTNLPHMLSCKSLGWRITRHNALVDDIHRWMRDRRVHVEKEFIIADGEGRIDLWVRSEGVVYWCDVVVTEPGCHSNIFNIVARASREAGEAGRAAEAGKVDKYKPLADRDGATVIPLAFETTGRRGEELEKFLRQLEDASTGQSLASLYLQLSVTTAKMNVAVMREAVRNATGVRALCGRRISRFRRRAPAA